MHLIHVLDMLSSVCRCLCFFIWLTVRSHVVFHLLHIECHKINNFIIIIPKKIIGNDSLYLMGRKEEVQFAQ